MKAWLMTAGLAGLSLVAGAVWFGSLGAVAEHVTVPTTAAAPSLQVSVRGAERRVASAVAKGMAAPRLPVTHQIVPVATDIPMNAEQAQGLMALMALEGDPRSPALQPSRPRVKASAAELADPALYAQFEARQSREEILAYTAGVQQIPLIRERIEQAAQSGERNAQELDEARAALQQLEQLQSQLQRQAPQLLPGAP